MNAGKLDSHARMIAVLEELRKASLVSDPFFQTQSISDGETQLRQLPKDSDPGTVASLHLSLAKDYRRIGENEKAIEHLTIAESLVEQHKLTENPEKDTWLLFEIAITWLRVAEAENCVHCRTGESCILPIRGGGIHTKQEGSRNAIRYLTTLLNKNPDDLTSRWLLNIASMTVGEYPDAVPARFLIPPNAFQSSVEFPRFFDVAGATGLAVVNCGGGSVAQDFDNDGLIDLMTSTWEPGGQILYFKNTGDGQFEDQTVESNLKGIVGGINMVQADYDNDGLVDVFVMRGAWLARDGQIPNSLLKNIGGGKFKDVTFDVGLANEYYPTSTAAWADFDNDGDLDLYVGNEGPPAQLFRNDGADGFVDVAEEAGVPNNRFAKAVVWGDYDNDRWPDLFVSNLEGENRLFHNNCDGHFEDASSNAGVVGPIKSFPSWFWDVNNDGNLDLFVGSYDQDVANVAADYLGMPHKEEPDALYIGDGKGSFVESARAFGLTRVTEPMGANFGDLDNDGFSDFYLGTGFPDYESLMPNLMFHNKAGRGFEEVTIPGGFGHIQKGHGVSFSDFDNDGDQDVFIEMGGAFPGDAFRSVLFQNPGFGHHWIRISLKGSQSNRCGIGVRIRADITDQGKTRSVYTTVGSGGSFGANPLSPQLGLASAEIIDRLEIYWPTSDARQSFDHVPVDCHISISESEPGYETVPLKSFSLRTDE